MRIWNTRLYLGLALAPLFPLVGAELSRADASRTHTVEMVVQDGKYRFVPEVVEAKSGDRVTFVLRSGGPHNVAFDPDRIPDAVEPKLNAAFPERMSPLAGPLLMKEGTTFTLTLNGVPAGSYPFFCMPHAAMGMNGTLRVVE